MVPQGSILEPLLFFTFIYDLHNDLTTSLRPFAGDTSPSSVVSNVNTSTKNLNNHLNKIRNCAIQWKMNFNTGSSKKSQKVIF